MSSVWFYEPFYDFDRFLDDALTSGAAPESTAMQLRGKGGGAQEGPGAIRPLKPRMDLHEDQEKNVVTSTFELPGVKKDDIHIEVRNNRLTISGETKSDESYEEKGFAVKERRYGKFMRALQLPPGIKEDQIKANMDNGILTVTFPKASPEKQAKRIAVN
ncbi:HSP20-like chaperone [Gymnopilus junonius]|uniref:HSP20-like chaperone n=1 Tax=Gymnopilus junonius TaxID=109634 RepID=A0A9P5NNQ2_GYMJU|nr:HSP20-like chaperone [Gymnopilus junonius]